jgi:hypothetical protein
MFLSLRDSDRTAALKPAHDGPTDQRPLAGLPAAELDFSAVEIGQSDASKTLALCIGYHVVAADVT